MTLVPVLPGRSPIVKRWGCWIYVSIHDVEHLRVRAALRQRLRHHHPDRRRRTGSTSGHPQIYRHALGAYRAWLIEEARWYATYRIDPPAPIRSVDISEVRRAHTPVLVLIHCAGCPRAFVPLRRGQRYCSRACHSAGMQQRNTGRRRRCVPAQTGDDHAVA